ncbi:hypothetical protein AM1_0130 [Acaryochloris marina MBIC11017]|uniref:Uncharacterized protein n=1 Tax=Acaryochloris marina (strain MBIC 11017) TaxID=329726 RepID=B0C6C2_ACAM1|nr:hypothetical protein AM1_0130 [Acaryochloris marina MBIC11017]
MIVKSSEAGELGQSVATNWPRLPPLRPGYSNIPMLSLMPDLM